MVLHNVAHGTFFRSDGIDICCHGLNRDVVLINRIVFVYDTKGIACTRSSCSWELKRTTGKVFDWFMKESRRQYIHSTSDGECKKRFDCKNLRSMVQRLRHFYVSRTYCWEFGTERTWHALRTMKLFFRRRRHHKQFVYFCGACIDHFSYHIPGFARHCFDWLVS